MLVLLAVNWLSVLVFQPSSGEPRVKVPFSPYFVQQVDAGKVKSIATSGAIQGTFKSKQRYPPNDSKATPTTLFSTQVPSFWNTNDLTTALKSQGVQVNATNRIRARRALADPGPWFCLNYALLSLSRL